MTIRGASHSISLAVAAVALSACGGAAGGISPQGGGDAQTQTAYVPQGTGVPAGAAAALQGKAPATEAFPQPLPEPLLAIGHGVSPDITAPIINDSGSYTNGPIIRATNTATGYGMEGITDGGGAGVYGHSASSSITSYGIYGFAEGGAGVYGYAGGSGKGVYGASVNGYGVEGISTSNASGYFVNNGSADALDASAGSGDGVNASSTSGTGLYAHTLGSGPAIYSSANTGDGVQAYSNTNFAVLASSGTGDGVYATSSSNDGVLAFSSSAIGVSSSTSGNNGPGALAYYGYDPAGNGADITGSYIGAVLRAPTGTGDYPLVLTDTSSNNLFYVDGDGDVYHKGTLSSSIATKAGGRALAYGATTTTPTIEDTGTAHLVNGSATVPLDSTFAQTIDSGRTYQVMLTPDADTRGLYVASKSGAAFVVREVQGGRGSFDFDYHIYATTLGHARERMALVGGAASGIPRAPVIHPNLGKPALRPATPR